MLAIDYLTGNIDRHWGNFGILRNADNLEILGHAPLYDSGFSLWYNVDEVDILANINIPSKPFKLFHNEQIKMVSDFSWINFTTINKCSDLLYDLHIKYFSKKMKRADIIYNAFKSRINLLEQIVNCPIDSPLKRYRPK
jgi:hypothetical protein